jgi:tRNA nucleotidyltransferase (CCA-adding enzyme)
MEIYRVGGAVRDRLLGDPASDNDWVVVGATPDAMLARGYKPIGKDFPVFLHPQSNEEYALARTERKVGPGYRGFECMSDPSVSLVDDLSRRDLTINAMAEAQDGSLIDPHNGQGDLAERVLRHVSPAFIEDPVRILRVARFAARYADRGFVVAPETLALMSSMVARGDTDHLVAERVFSELDRALAEASPQTFIQVLRDCGALARLLPEVEALFGVPQPADYHPEVDTGEHLLLTLAAAAADKASKPVRFACLLHDLGKALSPRDQWPAHHGHEQAGVPLVEAVCERLKAPKAYRDLAIRVCRHHLRCHRVFEMRPSKMLNLIEAVNGLRQSQCLEDFLSACQADMRGRAGRADDAYPQAAFLRQARAAATAVAVGPLRDEGFKGQALGEALRQARVRAIKSLSRPST